MVSVINEVSKKLCNLKDYENGLLTYAIKRDRIVLIYSHRGREVFCNIHYTQDLKAVRRDIKEFLGVVYVL